VRVLVDGAEIAKSSTAPFAIDADVSAVPRGRHRVELVATDASGNVSSPLAFEAQFLPPGGPPKVDLKGIPSSAPLKKKGTAVAAVTAELPILDVRFRLDGKDVGPVLTKLPFEVEIDPAPLAEGPHVLEVIVRDLDGNESRDELKFKTAKK
jgi:hypothetical protein